MNWFYAEGGAQKGPVSEQEFQALVQSGRITATTLVWREGMADWRPYASIATPPAAPGAAGMGAPAAAPLEGPTAVCAECGQVVRAGDTVNLAGRTICPVCKPKVVQRMAEGADPAGGPFQVEEFLAGLRAQGGPPVDIGGAISRGFNLVNKNLWPCIGITLLVYVIQIGVSQVPCVGFIGQLVLTGPLVGGLYYYMLLQARGQPATINEAFLGFRQPVFTQLLLASLVVQIIPVVFAMFLMVPFFISMQSMGPNPDAMPVWFIPVIVVAVPLYMYYMLITTPSYLIIADTRVGFWDGIRLGVRLVHMRFFNFVGFALALFVLGIAGILMLCVGLLWIMPVTIAAGAFIWHDIMRASEAGRAAASGAGRF